MSKQFIRILIIFMLHASLMGNSQVNAQEPSDEDPDIIAFNIATFHDSEGHHIDVWAEVYDPQGEDDIQTVKVIDTNGDEFILQYQGSGIYNGRPVFGLTLPPLGDTRIVATDISGNSCTVHYNVTNVVEQRPTMSYPSNGGVITENEPVFEWAEVTDTQSDIFYTFSVYRHDNGELIWQLQNISESQVQFNIDGNASEILEDRLSYDLEVMAIDTFSNTSYEFITFTFNNSGGYIFLENDQLKIKFQTNRPQAEQYTYKSNNEIIYGDIANEMFYARVFYQDEFYNVIPTISSTTQTDNQVCYHMQIDVDSNPAATFDLCYLLDGNTLQLTFGNISEESGYKLIHVQTPDLLTISGTQTGAKLVFPEFEGRLIDVATSDPGYAEVNLDLNGWVSPLLMAMLYHDGLAGIASYDHLDSILWTRIFDHPLSGRLSAVGMVFNYRYAPIDFSSATFIDVFDSETSELSVKLRITDDYDGDQDIDWMDGAKIYRDTVNATPDQRYVSSFIIKTDISYIFDDLVVFRKLYHLTDHNLVYSYLGGYHPYLKHIFGTEEDFEPYAQYLGSHDELKDAFRKAEELYNTYLSFDDVYLDLYPGMQTYDADLRVLLEDGTPAAGYPIDGFSDAFQADPYDYAIQEGLNRVTRTVERYPIKKSHHIDVLSLIIPKDYSPGSPSSRERNRRGIQLIIDEFAKYGINITSEGLTGYFVESGIGWFLDTPRILTSGLPFSNPKIIPLMEFIYHGKTLYGLYPDIYTDDLFSPEEIKINTFLEPLLLGANSATHISYTEENKLEFSENFYLIDLPWMALNQRFMQDYEEQGSYRKITYDSDTFVEIDYEDDTYTVQVDGRVIAQDYKTVYQKDEITILVFSRDQQALSELLPDGWDDNITLQKLTEDGYEDNIPFEFSNQTISFEAEANTPYKIKKAQDDVDGTHKSGFNYTTYLSINSDLPSDWGIDECMNHYKLYGFWESRAITFSLDEYLNANPDLPANWTLADALNHYNMFGKFENRLLAFDAQEYLSLYPDLPQDWNYDQAYSHYVNYGSNEERIASFDEVAYLELYSDLPSSWEQAEAFYHYIYFGQYEGRVYDPYDESVFTDDSVKTTIYYEDTDEDSYGNFNSSVVTTSQPEGYVLNNSDCNDADAEIHPGATEVCGDGIDQDCDGADMACPIDPNDVDDDDDGYTEKQGDCNDGDNSIHPNASKICGDGIDQDCDGLDEECGNVSEETSVRDFIAGMVATINQSDLSEFLALFAVDYMNNGENLVGVSAELDLSFIQSFSFNIDTIVISGDRADVSGTCHAELTDGSSDHWSEPANSELGLGFLKKTNNGWTIYGNQEKAEVWVATGHSVTPGDDHYFLRLNVDSDSYGISSATCSGPYIPNTILEPDPIYGGVKAFSEFSSMPPMGTVYTFTVSLDDGSTQTLTDVVKTYIPTAPEISITFQGGTAVFIWTDVSGVVPNASYYRLSVFGRDGARWELSDIPMTQTSSSFDGDNEAGWTLQSGLTYDVTIAIHNESNDYAYRFASFTMP